MSIRALPVTYWKLVLLAASKNEYGAFENLWGFFPFFFFAIPNSQATDTAMNFTLEN